MPKVRMISGIAMNVSSGFRKTLARPNTAPASRSEPHRSIVMPEKTQSATINARTFTPQATTSRTAVYITTVYKGLEELLELERSSHVALDLQLSRHVRGRRIGLAASDLHQCLLAGGDRAIGVLCALGDGGGSVGHRDSPGTHAGDVEHVAVVHAGGLGRVNLRGELVEE